MCPETSGSKNTGGHFQGNRKYADFLGDQSVETGSEAEESSEYDHPCEPVVAKTSRKARRNKKKSKQGKAKKRKLYLSTVNDKSISTHYFRPHQDFRLVQKDELFIFKNQTAAICIFSPFATMPSELKAQFKLLSGHLIQQKSFQSPSTTVKWKHVGKMYSLGWRKATTKDEIIGVSGTQAKINKNLPHYLLTQKNLEEAESFLATRFKAISNILYNQVKDQHGELSLPALSAQSFNDNHDFSFASHLTYTLDNYSDEAHQDFNVSSFSFGMWLPINKKTGELIEENFEVSGGNFIFPEHKFGINFENFDGVVEVAWQASLIPHCTEPSTSPANSLHNRLGLSVGTPLKSVRVVHRVDSGYYDDPSYHFRDVNHIVSNSKSIK